MKKIRQEEIPARLRFTLMGKGKIAGKEMLSYQGFLSLADVPESDAAPLEFVMNIDQATGEVQVLPELSPGSYEV
jgi:hypothetical protein